MDEQNLSVEQARQETAEAGAIPTPIPGPVPLPIGVTVSGLYATLGVIPGLTQETAEAEAPAPAPLPIPSLPIIQGEELRLDVDGRYPQMTASGTVPVSGVQRVHWIAKLQAAGANKYTGGIWYKDPAVSPFAYTNVLIQVTPSIFPSSRKIMVTFSGGGLPDRARTFRFRSPYFHKVEFEFDAATSITPETTVDTCAHPNRPATLPCENLSIETVFRRTGFDVSNSPATTVVPIADAGGNAQWSDAEMHDAMQRYWSRFANKPQWSMWTFFAGQHEMGPNLGGIMFDDIGPNERQGTALFYDSFISQAPAGDPNPAAFIRRMRFWTAVHEMGHSFNLAHSWQKSLPVSWTPLLDEPEARSFMNYPFLVSGGQSAFFADFEYRFSDAELLFMRHAPGRFVQMGNAAWFDHHGFRDANINPEPKFSLEIRVNRPQPVFEFLEPVMAELKVKNTSSDPQIIDANMLSMLDRITIVIKKDGKPARQYIPYAQLCIQPKAKVLMPEEADYGLVFLSAGRNGFDLAEPGRYIIQAALHLKDGDIVSAPLHLRVAPPHGYDEEYLAQDFFRDDVGRVLAFDGSRVLTSANATLREVADRLAERRVARHARIALNEPLARPGRVLNLADVRSTVLQPANTLQAEIMVARADPVQASKELTFALTNQPDAAAETLGHIDYKYYVDKLTDSLAEQGGREQREEAAQIQDTLYRTLANRGVTERVLQEVKGRHDSYGARQGARTR
jgi:hypothetical protein